MHELKYEDMLTIRETEVLAELGYTRLKANLDESLVVEMLVLSYCS